MEYKITRDALQNNLLYDTFEALNRVMKDLQLDVYVVGALARDIAMEILEMPPSPRRTADLDVAIALKDWSQFDLLKEHLLENHFILCLISLLHKKHFVVRITPSSIIFSLSR